MQEKFLDPNAVGNFDSIMEPIEAMNVGFIRSKLSGRYDMDQVFPVIVPEPIPEPPAEGDPEPPEPPVVPDTRNQVILKILIILCNYDFVRRNAARKVPEDYRLDWEWAIKELEKLQSGFSYADLPPYEDDEGEPIIKTIWGNNTNEDNYI